MLRLFLDTGSHENLLAVCNEEKTLGLAKLPSHGDTELVPTIEHILSELGHTYDDVTHLACVLGPGGFTSLRVGVTAINTLAYALDIPSAGIHLSDYWSSRVLFERVRQSGQVDKLKNKKLPDPSFVAADSSCEESGNFLWLHSTRRTQIFVKGYGADGTITPVGIFGLEDAAQLRGRYVGELMPEHQKLLTHCSLIPEHELPSVDEFLPSYLSEITYQRQQLTPWYGRSAD